MWRLIPIERIDWQAAPFDDQLTIGSICVPPQAPTARRVMPGNAKHSSADFLAATLYRQLESQVKSGVELVNNVGSSLAALRRQAVGQM